MAVGRSSQQTKVTMATKFKGTYYQYSALHAWVYRQAGRPLHCVECGMDDPTKRYEWANISGEYKRDVADYRRLCVHCHRMLDGQKHKPFCINGHAMTEDNIYVRPNKTRQCRTCKRENHKISNAKRKTKIGAA